MDSQHLSSSQRTTTSSPQLDGYLKGIRDEFDHLKHELDETKRQRDEYLTKFVSKAEELRQLRQSIARVCGFTDDYLSPLVSPSSEYYPCSEREDMVFDRPYDPANDQFEGERNQESDDVQERGGDESTVAGIASLALESNVSFTNEPEHSEGDVEFDDGDTKTTHMNLMHELAHKGRTYVSFSMDGKYLATASSFGVVSIFDSKTGERIKVMKDLSEKSLPGLQCLGFSPDSKYLATGESDGKVRIWEISQERVRNIFMHERFVNELDFSPNGQWIATCSHDGTVRTWRLRDGFSRVLTSQSAPWSVRFSTDGRFVASGSNSGQMLIWNVRTGKLVANWHGHSNVVGSLVFTPDGKGLLSASWDESIIHWDVASLGPLGMADPSSGVMEISRLAGHTDIIDTVSISPDGKWIASGSWDQTVRVWNAHDAALHCILRCPKSVWSVNFSPVGNYLAVGGDFDGVTIWNYANL